jgi:hypothetical protein
MPLQLPIQYNCSLNGYDNKVECPTTQASPSMRARPKYFKSSAQDPRCHGCGHVAIRDKLRFREKSPIPEPVETSIEQGKGLEFDIKQPYSLRLQIMRSVCLSSRGHSSCRLRDKDAWRSDMVRTKCDKPWWHWSYLCGSSSHYLGCQRRTAGLVRVYMDCNRPLSPWYRPAKGDPVEWKGRVSHAHEELNPCPVGSALLHNKWVGTGCRASSQNKSAGTSF